MKGKTLLETISSLKINLQNYLETKISYYGLSAFEKVVKVMNYIISNSIVIITFAISLLFLSGAAAIYIGKLLNSYELGLLIIGGVYFLLGLAIYILREKIFSPCITKSMLKIFFQKDDE